MSGSESRSSTGVRSGGGGSADWGRDTTVGSSGSRLGDRAHLGVRIDRQPRAIRRLHLDPRLQVAAVERRRLAGVGQRIVGVGKVADDDARGEADLAVPSAPRRPRTARRRRSSGARSRAPRGGRSRARIGSAAPPPVRGSRSPRSGVRPASSGGARRGRRMPAPTRRAGARARRAVRGRPAARWCRAAAPRGSRVRPAPPSGRCTNRRDWRPTCTAAVPVTSL